MGKEIERKFLVTSDDWTSSADGGTAIRQGYLCLENDRTVRVRLANGNATLTIKSARQGMSRSEYEYEIPGDDAREMLDALCQGTPILKTRFRVEHGEHTFELDVFEDANEGLVLAEVELEREDESVDLPGWAGREVTDDQRFYNAYLARRPFEEWQAEERPIR